MNGKKARELRKQLGMTKTNLRKAEYGVIKKVKKNVHFRNNVGQLLLPVEVEREVIVNKNKYHYRKVKKQLKKGY